MRSFLQRTYVGLLRFQGVFALMFALLFLVHLFHTPALTRNIVLPLAVNVSSLAAALMLCMPFLTPRWLVDPLPPSSLWMRALVLAILPVLFAFASFSSVVVLDLPERVTHDLGLSATVMHLFVLGAAWWITVGFGIAPRPVEEEEKRLRSIFA